MAHHRLKTNFLEFIVNVSQKKKKKIGESYHTFNENCETLLKNADVKNANQKVNRLTRVSPYMNTSKRRIC